jgi:transcriptional regulator with XRE-family HTH domain
MVKTLGQRIRELRGEHDLSLRELARKLDISAAFLSDIELGRRHPSDQLLAKIARSLGTSVEDLRQLDTRPVVDELRRLASTDPAYGFAFRQIVEKRLTAEQLLNLLAKQPAGGNKQ